MKTRFSLARSCAVIVTIATLTAAARGELVPHVTVTTNMGTNAGYDIANIVNGSGLSELSLDATHSGISTNTSWVSAGGGLSHFVNFDLGSAYSLDAIAIWNYQGTVLAYGTKDLGIYTSLDGQHYSALSFETLPLGSTLPFGAHIVDASGTIARYVRFDILSGYGTAFRGLSEVQFESKCIYPYGVGCYGTGGFVPKLSGTCPITGDFITLNIDHAFGGAHALMFLGLGKAQLPTGNGCDLLIAPILPLIVSIPLGGFGPNNGSAVISSPLSSMHGSGEITMQVFVADPGAPGGYSGSNAIEWILF